MVKAKLNGEYEIVLPKHRADRPEWYTEHGWEKKRLAHMKSKLNSKDVMCYVGAEEGEMCALTQMWGADVFMIEPNPKVWPNIKAIWEANKLKNPLGCFVGFAGNTTNENPRLLDFEIGYKDGWPLSAYGEVISDHGFRELYQQAESTPQITIDQLGHPFTAMSIDVEGSEWRVLEGAEQTIEKHMPKIWLSGHPEFMQHQFGEHLGDLRRWLKNKGYAEELIAYDHEVHLYYEIQQ